MHKENGRQKTAWNTKTYLHFKEGKENQKECKCIFEIITM